MTTVPNRITGTLVRHAEARFHPDGTAWLHIELRQPCVPYTVRAAWRMGQGPAAQIAARATAHHLRTGAHVTVHASRFDIVLGREPHLVLLDVQGIDHRPVLPRWEAA